MAWFKRIFLFVLTNILIIITLTIVTSLLGIQPYLSSAGIDLTALAIFSLIWGMGGAFISLWLSKFMAKMAMGVQEITIDDPQYGWVVERVYTLAKRAGLEKMPEVGIYESPELNAFATGPSKNNSLVAVSTGLIENMDRNAVDGVLGHEVAHIANGDMVTMTLLQGIINAFVIFFARIIAFIISNFVKDEELQTFVQFGVIIVLEILLSLLGMIVVAWFSRYREYRADEGGARLSSRSNMIHALETLKKYYEIEDPRGEELATFKIKGKSGGFLALFATHPPLDDRIEHLKSLNI
ncbi:MAG: protease HtpX [Leptospiraceae bacterium]|nr:protease HtpX [Leptospiraceae bacterium]MDW7976579.1 protease HtpX [Leptospiraceae bacterium]